MTWTDDFNRRFDETVQSEIDRAMTRTQPISILIARLQSVMAEHGDLPLLANDGYYRATCDSEGEVGLDAHGRKFFSLHAW